MTFPASKRAALSFTYDDATSDHLDVVAPALEQHGFRGTFYTPVHQGFIQRWDDWAALSARGHELGNHTLFHPCRREVTPSDWIRDYMNLKQYDAERWCAEADLANALLDKAEGRTGRTFGNTCHHHILGSEENPTPIEDLIHPRFIAPLEPHGICHIPSIHCNWMFGIWEPFPVIPTPGKRSSR